MQSIPAPGIQAVFIIPPEVHLLDITGPAHIFYEAAAYGAPVQLLFSSVFSDQTAATSSSALAFHQLKPYNSLLLKAGDFVFIPGLSASLLLDDAFLLSTRPFQHWLRQQQQQGVIICSVCTGAFLLAASGLLDGRKCTTHWKYAERFALKYPAAKLQANRLFVQEDLLYTSAGVSSGIDLALYLTEILWGANFAARIAKEVVIYFRRGPDDPQLSVFTKYRNHLDDRIHTVQDLLMQSIDHKLSIGELAQKVNMSPRNLTRMFRLSTGITINAYLQQLRAEHAARLMQEGHSVKAATLDCGLKSTNQFRHIMKGATRRQPRNVS